MTEMLRRAFDLASTLPADEQDALAAHMMEEIHAVAEDPFAETMETFLGMSSIVRLQPPKNWRSCRRWRGRSLESRRPCVWPNAAAWTSRRSLRSVTQNDPG